VKRISLGVVITVSALFGVALVASPASAAPTVSVTPNAALLDGDAVTVSASGFTAGAPLAIIECTNGFASVNDCDLSTASFPQADNNGNLSVSYNVFRVISTPNTPSTDCAPANCSLLVANINDQTEVGAQVLNFDASVPPPPHLTITATVTGGSFDKAGDVVVTGTLDCSLPADVQLQGDATQRAGRAIYQDYGFGETQCDGLTPYTLVLNPTNGIFRGGSASVEVDFFSSTGRGVSGSVVTTLKLNGAGGNGKK
jgi:hypothetical protein